MQLTPYPSISTSGLGDACGESRSGAAGRSSRFSGSGVGKGGRATGSAGVAYPVQCAVGAGVATAASNCPIELRHHPHPLSLRHGRRGGNGGIPPSARGRRFASAGQAAGGRRPEGRVPGIQAVGRHIGLHGGVARGAGWRRLGLLVQRFAVPMPPAAALHPWRALSLSPRSDGN